MSMQLFFLPIFRPAVTYPAPCFDTIMTMMSTITADISTAIAIPVNLFIHATLSVIHE